MKRLLLVAFLVALVVASPGLVAVAEEGKGCGVTNCHAIGTKYTLAVESKNVKGHPAVPETALFEDCLKCHKSGKLAFGPILHKVHYHEGENHFTAERYAGKCTHCHKLDLTTGAVTVVYAK